MIINNVRNKHISSTNTGIDRLLTEIEFLSWSLKEHLKRQEVKSKIKTPGNTSNNRVWAFRQVIIHFVILKGKNFEEK